MRYSRPAPGSIASLVFATALVMGPGCFAQPSPEPLHLSATLASDYVQHGLAQTDDSPSARVAADFEHKSGFFAGGWLATVDYRAESRFRHPRDSQLGIYAGYLERRGDWSAHFSLSRYIYPGIERSYDYSWLTAGFSYRDRYFFSVARSDSFLSIYDRALEVQSGIELPWIWDLEFGLNAGRFEASGALDTAYNFWDAGLSRPLGRFAIDLRFHDNNYERTSLLGNYGGEFWVMSLTYAILPRDQRP